jgi:hypothetical protein
MDSETVRDLVARLRETKLDWGGGGRFEPPIGTYPINRDGSEAADAIERLTRERDEAQRGYLNTKLWWETERQNARKHEGTIAGMQTQIDELEAERDTLRAELEVSKAAHKIKTLMISDLRAALATAREAAPDDLRAKGWAVAVHNDYRLAGENHTFWLFTNDGRCIKGEGKTDADALNQCRAALAAIPPAPENLSDTN